MVDLVSQPKVVREQKTFDRHEQIRGLQRGYVFWVNVPEEHIVGSEQFHRYEPTAFLIVSRQQLHSKLPIILGVPLSICRQNETRDSEAARHFRIRIPSREFTYYELHTDHKALEQVDVLALTEQVRVLAHERLQDGPAGRVSLTALNAVEAGIRYVFDIPSGLVAAPSLSANPTQADPGSSG